jgi:hypothetical protein
LLLAERLPVELEVEGWLVEQELVLVRQRLVSLVLQELLVLQEPQMMRRC